MVMKESPMLLLIGLFLCPASSHGQETSRCQSVVRVLRPLGGAGKSPIKLVGTERTRYLDVIEVSPGNYKPAEVSEQDARKLGCTLGGETVAMKAMVESAIQISYPPSRGADAAAVELLKPDSPLVDRPPRAEIAVGQGGLDGETSTRRVQVEMTLPSSGVKIAELPRSWWTEALAPAAIAIVTVLLLMLRALRMIERAVNALSHRLQDAVAPRGPTVAPPPTSPGFPPQPVGGGRQVRGAPGFPAVREILGKGVDVLENLNHRSFEHESLKWLAKVLILDARLGAQGEPCGALVRVHAARALEVHEFAESARSAARQAGLEVHVPKVGAPPPPEALISDPDAAVSEECRVGHVGRVVDLVQVGIGQTRPVVAVWNWRLEWARLLEPAREVAGLLGVHDAALDEHAGAFEALGRGDVGAAFRLRGWADAVLGWHEVARRLRTAVPAGAVDPLTRLADALNAMARERGLALEIPEIGGVSLERWLDADLVPEPIALAATERNFPPGVVAYIYQVGIPQHVADPRRGHAACVTTWAPRWEHRRSRSISA